MRAAPPHALHSALLLALTLSCGGAEPSERPRNVLLIVVDTLRADRLSCYGYERATSPTIDALAARGVRYTRCHSQGCWTVPSMISMMSGLYVTELETGLPSGPVALGETLQDAGYHTAAFLGNRVLTKDRGFRRGFDHFQAGEPNGRALSLAANCEEWYEQAREDIASSRGLFLWFHPMNPHTPYFPEEEERIFRDAGPGSLEVLARWRRELPRVEYLAGEHPRLDYGEAVAQLHTQSNSYDGEVLGVDRGIARLLDFLEAEGELERTLVIFASDHGEMLWEHPHYPQELSLKANERGLPRGVMDIFVQGHRAWFYRELWNTPLIMAGPGVPQGELRHGLAANLDIYPTILEALDVAPRGALDGQSLYPAREPTREAVFGYGYGTTAMLDASGLKLVEHEPERFHADESGEWPVTLYDANSNPGETRDLAEQRPAVTRRLRDELQAWRARHAREGLQTGTSEDAQEILDALGYGGD